MVEHFNSETKSVSNHDDVSRFFEEVTPKSNAVTFPIIDGNELTVVHMTKDGPKIELLGIGRSPLEKDAVPQDQLPQKDREAIESLPALRSGGVCLPPSEELLKQMGPGPIGYCNYKDTSELTEQEKMTVRNGSRIHLRESDKVAKTSDGYLIISPLPAILD